MGSTSLLRFLLCRDYPAAAPIAARHNGSMTRMGDLLGPDPVLLPGDPPRRPNWPPPRNPAIVAAAHPSASVAWAALAEDALAERQGRHRLPTPAPATTAGWISCAATDWKGFGPVPVQPRAQPRVPALCGRAGAGRRSRSARPMSISAASDLLDDCDPERARAELGVGLASVPRLRTRSRLRLRAVPPEPSRGRVRRAVSTRARLIEHQRRIRRAGQVRGDHVLARHQRPHVQVVHFGHAVDGAQRRAQFVDVDVGSATTPTGSAARPGPARWRGAAPTARRAPRPPRRRRATAS